MGVLRRIASLLMSSTPAGRKRRAKPQPQAIDLTADDASLQSGKRSRSSRSSDARPANAAGSGVINLTGSVSPAGSPASNTRSSAAGCAAEPSAQAPASPAAAGGDLGRSSQGSGGSRKAARATAKAAEAEAAAAAQRQSADNAASAAAGAAAASTGTRDMFFRSRAQPAPAPEAKPNGSTAADELPVWHSMQGAKRLQAEFKYLTKQIAAGKVTQIHDVTFVNDNIFKWQFKLKDFDNDCEGGRNLNEDLSVLSALHGQDHLLMEISFPKDYPHSPFFLRMITPRCVWYTGHVTAGGSICIEVLTQSGSSNSWNSSMCVESIMNTVILNMLHVESVMVRTATGPGGLSGPLRIDLEHRYAYNVMAPYSESEAKSAFSRMLSHHKRNGW